MPRVLVVLLLVGPGPPCGSEESAREADEQTPGPTIVEAPLRVSPRVRKALDTGDAARFERDLRFIARERLDDREAWAEIRDRCVAELSAAGFETATQMFPAGSNIVGIRAGARPADPAVLMGAHYDHIRGCAGADDNASGTAALLEAARIVGPVPTRRTIIATCWDAEEEGLLGSDFQAQAMRDAGTPLRTAISLDAVAYTDMKPGSQHLPPGVEAIFPDEVAKIDARQRRGDFIGVLFDSDASDAGAYFLAHARAENLPALELGLPRALLMIDATADLRRSDHASFWRRDYPALLINDTAPFRAPTYHCNEAPDTVDTLDLGFAFKVTRATAGAVLELAEPV